MRSTHSTRNLPLLTAKRQNNKPSGVAPFFGALAAIVILLLIGYQAFPPHIHASFADHDFPNGAQHMTTNISIPGGTLQGVAVTGMGLATAGGSGAQGARGPTLVAYMVGAAMGPSGPLPSELSNFQFFLAQGVQPYPSVSYLLLMHKVWADMSGICNSACCTTSSVTASSVSSSQHVMLLCGYRPCAEAPCHVCSSIANLAPPDMGAGRFRAGVLPSPQRAPRLA